GGPCDARDSTTAFVNKEIETFVRAGLTPYQALVTSTRNPAVFFGTLDETGTVEAGKRADLVLLDANPLDDIRNIERTDGVVLNGRWFTRAELIKRMR